MRAFHHVLAILALLAAMLGSTTRAQTEDPTTPILLDEFGGATECDFRGRTDLLLAELAQKPDHRGYVINYKGLNMLPGQRETFDRSSIFSNHFEFRRFDASRITIIDGGLRNEFGTEFWILPPGADTPLPSRNVEEPVGPAKQSVLFDHSSLYFDGDESIEEEFLLPAVIAEREEEERVRDEENAQYEVENAAAASAGNDEEQEVAEFTEVPLDVDPRTPEELDEAKFNWLSSPFGKAVSERNASGRLIFYADQQMYDIEAVRSLVEEGIRRLEASHGIKGGKIKAVFGGYRESIEVDFWIVPKGAKKPVPTPAERPAKEPVEEVSAEN